MEKPQSPDIQAQLNQARENLQRLGNAVSELVNLSPDVFNDEAIKARLQDFQQAYEEATQRLANPTFRIATIGTTSSGKSTIVNALMGRRIAPIEAGEMSGGVLTLTHSHERKLIIEVTENAVWETGEWTDLSDGELYDKIQVVMHSYHERRKKKELIAPKIKAFAPLFPANELTLSGLPHGIGLEFLDLPGLKSIQDRDNLKVIQPLVGKAFSLVALDYMQVDEQHRQKLLAELKRVVTSLQGRTDSMIFILNRVDNRGSDDLPIEKRLEKLKQEIQDTLSLPELPDVIPFNARLLYYAQCAWGTTALNTDSNINAPLRSKLLKSLFHDCATVIKNNISGDRDLRNWFRDIEDNLEDNQSIDDETMRQILAYALKWSGGEKLWHCIKKRIEESFSELVVLPTLLDIFKSYDSFGSSVNLFIQTAQIGNLEDVKQKQEELMKFRKEFPELAKKIKHDFDTELDEYREAIKNRGATKDSQIKQKAEKKKREEFEPIFRAVDDVKADLVIDIIKPVRDAFKNNEGAYDLKDKLQEVIAPPLAENIAREYDHVSRRITVDFTLQNDYLRKKARIDDQKKMQELEHDEKYVRLLFQTIKDALTIRAEFSLQATEKAFTKALNDLVEDQIDRLKLCIPEDILDSLGIEQAVMSDIQKKLSENLIKLPDKLFDFNTEIKDTKLSLREKIGTKEEEKTKDVGSCLNKKTETYTEIVPEYGNVEYKQLLIPNTDTMAKQWADGIENSENDLWDILFDWIGDKLNYSSALFDESINNIVNLTERFLDEQSHKLLEQKLELEKLAILKSCYNTANNIKQELAQKF